ncbi:nitrilase-related carbon-nitrogen hydrolase [Brachybacterium fresconis]|uniref:Amidohydrolase/molybdopterin-guanine dinucleotide biosynthesis protein A n=1 Tax=Brachybacterium fresconis TaxID=173363 RepID=A0ABS4YJN7_9MICO|nr:nitrilase-related carbon-nitrogen hydrolase [Brachybacterium fresconis]MBP2408627.1 putative amidohydrolase/molybdopterin-guanine dinucleotide biosynthesis protein A [Brachybacterium fresconis]
MSSSEHERTATTAAIILAGGAASRMGGQDKTRLPIAGATALERVLRVAPADRRIVVGPGGTDGDALAARHDARFVLEDPPRSGPLAALGRGIAALEDADPSTTVLVLGGDMPMLRRETLTALAATSRAGQKVTALTAEDGRLQFLCAAWPLARLRRALADVENPGGGWADLSLRRLYARLEDDELVSHRASGAEGADIDTPDALEQVRRAAGPRIALAQIEVSEDYGTTAGIVRRAVADAAAAGARLVLLPEATLTPFGTDLRAAAEAHHEEFAQLIQELATDHGLVVVAGSFTPADGARVHNTLIARGPRSSPGSGAQSDPGSRVEGGDGGVGSVCAEYRKIHLFDAYGVRESDTVAPGDQLITLDLDGARLGLATCYDVRFPEQFAALARRGAHAVLLPMAWGDGPTKSEQLRLLVGARALDSTAVVLAADQAPPPGHCGRTPRGIGQSAVVGPLGEIRQELGREPGMLLVDLDLAEIESAREALPVLTHAVELPRP